MSVSQDVLKKQLAAAEPLLWCNPDKRPFATVRERLPLTRADIDAASARLQRFAPFLAQVFPQTAATQGIIESEMIPADALREAQGSSLADVTGALWLKLDSHLPVAGSIKARGGFHEVLEHAEKLAEAEGLLAEIEDYRAFASEPFRQLFSRQQIIVSSTGNLGMSIGIMSAKLGFNVCVHMSADAKAWKKERLRAAGVEVIEHQSDYSAAVIEGREQARLADNCHFVDDEDSTSLFLGYAVAALRLEKQLVEKEITVDESHPLIVYLPCGVGGAPGGITFGLKQVFGDAVHCIFVEPTHAPCMLLGMATGLHHDICVQDIGLDNLTCADGLAVGRPSAFVGKVMAPLLDGSCTVADEDLHRAQVWVKDQLNLALEPSAVSSLFAPARVQADANFLAANGLVDKLDNAIHLLWATGGSLVPAAEFERDYQRGQALINSVSATI